MYLPGNRHTPCDPANNVDIMADTLGKGTFIPGEKVTLTWQLEDIILPKPGDD